MKTQPLKACKQYCLAAGATQGNIAYKQNVSGKLCARCKKLISENKKTGIYRLLLKT
jgi:hypothetical protein